MISFKSLLSLELPFQRQEIFVTLSVVIPQTSKEFITISFGTFSYAFFSCPVVLMGTVWTPLPSIVVAMGMSVEDLRLKTVEIYLLLVKSDKVTNLILKVTW